MQSMLMLIILQIKTLRKEIYSQILKDLLIWLSNKRTSHRIQGKLYEYLGCLFGKTRKIRDFRNSIEISQYLLRFPRIPLHGKLDLILLKKDEPKI